jgi:hypothetical protein
MSSTTTTTRLEAAPITSTSAEWALANNRVQDRIIRLQEQRACEATGKTGGISRFGNFLKPLSTSQRQSFRVGQLDTELLDNELLDLLKGQLWGGLKYFRVCFLNPDWCFPFCCDGDGGDCTGIGEFRSISYRNRVRGLICEIYAQFFLAFVQRYIRAGAIAIVTSRAIQTHDLGS